MKRVLIVGAGAQGGPCASILAKDRDISEIILSDIDLGLANKVKEKIGSDKITTVKLDAGKVEDIERVAKGADVIVNLTLCRFNANIMRAALMSETHYVDSAFDNPIWTQLTESRPLEIDNEFKEAGLTALIGCGGAPGITNVLARYICDKLDHVDEIYIRVGDRLLERPEDVVRAWEPTWCPEIAFTDYADEPTVFEDGEYKKYPPFSGCEEYNFPDPVGSLLVCYHHHEEAVTLPRFIDKGIQYVGFKYPVDPIVGSLVKMGFAKPEVVEVKGVKVVPMDVLMRLVKHPANTFLAENENTAKAPPKSAHPYVVEIKGRKSGEDVKYKIWWPYSLFTNVEEKEELYRKFGTTTIGVALPVITGAKMCMEGDTKKGVIAPECLDPVKFLKVMAEVGWPMKFSEVLSKETSIS